MKRITTKLRSRIRIGPVGEAVLAAVGVAGIIAVAVVAPNVFQTLAPVLKKKKRSPKQEVQRNIDSLIRSRLLRRTISKNGEMKLELTARGKWEFMIRHRSLDVYKGTEWDELWRVVVFDVPNSKDKLRAELRRGVRMYGFYMLQKSVWVYPYPCDDFVQVLRRYLEIHDDVLYMTVQSIENESVLRKHFNLKTSKK